MEKAKQERQEKVVRAEGEAEAAKMISSHFTSQSPLLILKQSKSFDECMQDEKHSFLESCTHLHYIRVVSMHPLLVETSLP